MPSNYGELIYGVDTYASDNVNLRGINSIYIGCEPTDGKEANGIFDELQVFFEDKTDNEIASILNASQSAEWTSTHQLLAHFENTLDAGNIFLNQYSVNKWRIYKKHSNETQYKFISEVINDENADFLEIDDKELANKISYDYAIEGVSNLGTVSNKYEINNVKIEFSGIRLLDRMTGNSFSFRYSIGNPRIDTTFTPEKDRSEIKTFSRFPLIRRGETDYERGNLECAIFEDDIPLIQQINELKQFEGSDLLLKFDTGQMYPVDISNITPTYITESDNKIATIKCDWVQIGEAV